MTYGDLKKRVFSLLDIDAREEGTEGSLATMICESLPQTANAIARKAALYLKALFKTESLYFSEDDYGAYTMLPEDAATVKEIFAGRNGGRKYGRVSFETVGEKLYFFEGKEGFYKVGYYAYPKRIDENTADEDFLEMSDAVWDTVAYGICAELCSKVYPGDMKRYMRLATEFDERMTAAFPLQKGDRVSDTVFSGRSRMGRR